MLADLKFVVAAVAKKDYMPELTHFRIKDGRVTGYNGMIALSSPIPIDFDAQPKAAPLLAAVAACKDVVALNMTAAGRLSIKSGAFKAFVECLPNERVFEVAPEGETVELGPNFLAGIKGIAPIMGVDASRPWAMGIKLQAQSMYATNNVTLIEYWHGSEIPFDVVIPSQAINELLRIGEAPTRVQVDKKSLSFWFTGDRWLRTQLLDGGAWPTDRLAGLMAKSTGRNFTALTPEFAEALQTLKPFMDEHSSIYLTPTTMQTSKDDGTGASVELPLISITEMQCYNQRNLTLLAEVADRIDWTLYPQACPFYKDERQRGVIIGRRV